MYACICMYFLLYMPVYVCMIAYISKYKQIQTDIFVHMLCYIRIYFVYTFVIFVHICTYCSYVCIFFAGKSLSRRIWARMSTGSTICTYMQEYVQYTCKIHASYRHFFRCPCMLYEKADIIYVCICMYMYIWRIYVHVYTGGVHTCLYQHVYVCLCMYMPVSETHACI